MEPAQALRDKVRNYSVLLYITYLQRTRRLYAAKAITSGDKCQGMMEFYHVHPPLCVLSSS